MKTNLSPKTVSLFLFLSLLFNLHFINSYAQNPSSSWAKHYDSGYDLDAGADVHLGGDGRIYVCGKRNTSSGLFDGVVVSYTTSGTQNWIDFYNGPEGTHDELYSIASHGTGSNTLIYATGRANNSGTNQDMVLLKYTQAGTRSVVIWNSSGNNPDNGAHIITDAAGNIYIAGQSYTSSNGQAIRVWKYNSSLSLLSWYIYDLGTTDEFPTEMKIDAASDYLYVSGYKSNFSNTDHDALLIKLATSDLTQQWVSPWDGSITNDLDEAHSLAIAGNGDIYTCGQTQTSSNKDGLILRYNTSGSLVHSATTWNNSTHNLNDWFRSIASNTVSGTDYVYVTGTTQYDPNPINPCDFNIITNKYTATCCSLTVSWANEYDAIPGLQCPSYDHGYQVLISPQTGKIHVTGQSEKATVLADYCAIRYNSGGTQEWIKEYNRSNGNDQVADKYPMALEYTTCWNGDNVILTGRTQNSSQFDFTTVKYYSLGSCEGPEFEGRYAFVTTQVKMYPNPAKDKAIFEFPVDEENPESGILVIADMLGRIVRQEDISGAYTEVDLKSFSDGIYNFQYFTRGRMIHSGRFIVSK